MAVLREAPNWLSYLLPYRTKMPQPELQCPFCEQTSSRPQGLAAHIRSRHPKPYTKWLKTPTRLADAQNSPTKRDSGKAESAENGAEPERSSVTAAIQPEPPVLPTAAADGNPALDLLKKAHVQLLDRKQNIETELARLNGLTRELDAIDTQIQALDKTLQVFESQAAS